MPNTLVHSRWKNGSLVFHDADDLGVGAEIFQISPSTIYIGTSTNDVTVTAYGDVTLYGDLDLADEDISVAVGKYIYLDGSTGNDYLRAATDNNVILNGQTTVKLGIAGTAEVSVTGAALYPETDNGQTLGITNTNEWSDLFLASGGVIGWDNNNCAITHTAGVLTVTGDIVSSNAGGFALEDELASATNPTLCPYKADLTTGIGWATAQVVGIVSGAAILTLAAATATFAQKIVQDDTTNSTVSTNGSIQTDGGLGVVLNTFLGGTLSVGVSGVGETVTFYGDNALSNFVWAEAGDTNGSLTLGATTDSVDLRVYGTTATTYLHWDGSADDLLLVGTATQLAVAGTTNATTTTSGSLRTAGGCAVLLDFFIGGDIYIATGNKIDFNAGDVTLTHTSGLLTMLGGGLTVGAAGTLVNDVIFYGESNMRLLWNSSTPALTLTDAPVASTITGGAGIGYTATMTTSATNTNWALGFFGSTTASMTSGNSGNLGGGCFEVNLASGYAATQNGLVVGAYIGAYSSQAGRQPTAGLWIETIPGTGVSFAATGGGTDMPMLALVTSGAGTKSSLAIEFGNEAAGKTISSGTTGNMEYHQTIQIKINGELEYLPYSTVEGTYTTAYPIVLGDDVELRFGDAAGGDIVATWTEEELLFTDTRTLPGNADYFRTIHAAPAIAMGTADKYGGISCYLTLSDGSGGTWAGALVGTLEQGTTKNIDGYMAAGIFEAKNSAVGCSTASCIDLVWKNQAATGFGGVMHSFIRCDDTSPSDRDVQCLFELYNMDATAAASATDIVCQAGAANTASHVIKISANGVPYWIMMDSTPPA